MRFLPYANFPQNQKSHKARTLCMPILVMEFQVWGSINFCLKVKFFKGFYDNFWNRKPTKCDLYEKYQQ